VGLTTLPPSVSRLSRQCGILNISQSYKPPGPVTGIGFTSFFNSWLYGVQASGNSQTNFQKLQRKFIIFVKLLYKQRCSADMLACYVTVLVAIGTLTIIVPRVP
jgi:hypothetical protein